MIETVFMLWRRIVGQGFGVQPRKRAKTLRGQESIIETCT